MGMQMKIPAIAVVLFLAGAAAAGAQSLPAVPTVGGNPGIGSSGSLNSSGAINHPGWTPSSVGDSDPRASRSIEATNPGEYVSSTFENYDSAVNIGRNAGLVRPPTLVEAAHAAQQARATGALKAPIVLEKDREGNLVIVAAKGQADAKSSASPTPPASVSGTTAPAHIN
jgi:hypothetical protein